ncbi:cadherin-like and PC-esterase domain-containing protein 1 [Pelodytes ibericus]
MGWRRRYCPSTTFVCLAVTVCVVYQSLTFLWKSASWTIEVYATDTQGIILDTTPKNKHCRFKWTTLYTRMKEFEDTVKKNLNQSTRKRAFLNIHPSLHSEDYNLYEDILKQLGYTVFSSYAGNVKALVYQEELLHGVLNHRDVLIYIPSNKRLNTNCKKIRRLTESTQIKQVNLLPEIEQLLCSKQRICNMVSICPESQNLSVCLNSSEESTSRSSLSNGILSHSRAEKKEYKNICGATYMFEGLFSLWTRHEHPSRESPIMRAYVIVTSMSPLRAFIHSTGIVQNQSNDPYVPIKLQHFYEIFFKTSLASKAFSAMKETIGEFLLTLEVMSEASAFRTYHTKSCSECFQLLTVDVGHYNPLRPTVLQVKEHFSFEGLNVKDQKTKELIIGNAFSFILQNTSSSFVEVFGNLQKLRLKEDACWKDGSTPFTQEELHMLFSFAQEVALIESPGEFEMIYPSTSSLLLTLKNELYKKIDPMNQLRSISLKHMILSDLLQYFYLHQNNAAKTDSPISILETKQMNCTKDNNTLSHIRHIFSSPKLDLNPDFNPKIKAYYAEVPFDVVTVEIGAEPANCRSQVHLDNKDGPRVANYSLGLGFNQIIIQVMDESKPTPVSLGMYRITVHREDRPSLPLFSDYKICGFVQDCGLVIDSEKSCGLQPLSAKFLSRLSQTEQRKCNTGDATGQWIVPCMSCTDNRTCDWRAISWQPYNCQHPILSKKVFQQCLDDRKILFIGDSTNRGIMYYLIERVNETLQEWQKSHNMKFYNNINQGRTMVSYSYYPKFWIDATQRPTFEQALENLIERSRPLKNTNQTILVVGGVQWLNPNHLKIIQKVLKWANLPDILVIVKSTGMGFHLPVHGIHTLSPIQIKQLLNENLLILRTAKLYRYEVVDTLSITMGRYKEFLQGKCGCHFHEVVKSNIFKEHYRRKMKLLKNYTFGSLQVSPLHDHSSNFQSPYHVMGPVNQAYSEILLSRMCV